jgi:hypothetical protein
MALIAKAIWITDERRGSPASRAEPPKTSGSNMSKLIAPQKEPATTAHAKPFFLRGADFPRRYNKLMT